MGFRNARNCLGYRLIVKNIERAGDHAALIASSLSYVIKIAEFILIQYFQYYSS